MSEKTFVVHAEWDPEVRVWYVSESDVPGLITEADTVPDLIKTLRSLIPELLELNGVTDSNVDVPFELLARYHETVEHAKH